MFTINFISRNLLLDYQIMVYHWAQLIQVSSNLVCENVNPVNFIQQDAESSNDVLLV